MPLARRAGLQDARATLHTRWPARPAGWQRLTDVYPLVLAGRGWHFIVRSVLGRVPCPGLVAVEGRGHAGSGAGAGVAGWGRQRRDPCVRRGGQLVAATERLVEVIAASAVRACRGYVRQSSLPPKDLAAAIPGARLVRLEGVGDEIPPPAVWDAVVPEVRNHLPRA
jgi:hypothetical protein